MRYYSDNRNEVRVRFLKAAVFGNAYAESVANELLRSTSKNQFAIDTGPCQLHVVHNSFRKGVEGYGSDVENLCIDILHYFFKLSLPRRDDYADEQQKLNQDEFVFLQHVQSWWLSLIPAIERVKKQFPALKEYFRKLPHSAKNIAKNTRYK